MFGFFSSKQPTSQESVPHSSQFESRPAIKPVTRKRMNPETIPANGMKGKDLLEGVIVANGRRAILEDGSRVEQIRPNSIYSKQELLGKKGKGIKITSMPDRRKGGYHYGPSYASRRLIAEQVEQIGQKVFHQPLEFDHANARWMIVPRFNLPKNWHHIAGQTPLMVVFPDEYPALPPIGFYMRADLGSLDGHLHNFTAHDAWQEPINQGWHWYCLYMPDGAWQPSDPWQRGDNLFTYFHLIREALNDGGR